jgi:16S rRNA (guanine527-N7)-methyltransferase
MEIKSRTLLRSGLTALGVDEIHTAQFELYADLLRKWSRVYNLTALSDLEDIIIKHFFDSLVIRPFLIGQTIIDVGTGAGFPGVPLAIIEPTRQFFLLDSQIKKIHFLIAVKEALHLSNVTVIHSRIENFFPQIFFDNVISRAFTSLDEIWKKTQHLLAGSGQLLIMKGRYPEEELNLVSKESFKVHPLKVPYLAEQRHLVCIHKNTSRE